MLQEFKGKVAFFGRDPFTFNSTGTSLWVTDGTDAGTVRLGSTISTTSAQPEQFTVSGDYVYFRFTVGFGSADLCRHDGTNWSVFVDQASPQYLTDFNGTLLYGSGQLWAVDPGAATPRALPGVSNIVGIARSGNTAYDSAYSPSFSQSGLWRVDVSGTAAPQLLAPSNSLPQQITASAGRVWFFNSTAQAGFEPWVTDGTVAGTLALGDLNPGTAASYVNGYPNPEHRAGFVEGPDGYVYFQATTAAAGTELFRTDGTPAGTSMVADFMPGPADSLPMPYLRAGGKLFVAAEDPLYGREWRLIASPSSLPGWVSPGAAATWNTGTKTLTVTGLTTINADPGDASVVVDVSGGAAALTINPMTGDGVVRLGTLHLSNGATASLSPGGGQRTLVVGSLAVETGATLDLADHAMIVRSGGVAVIQPLLAAGINGGSWNGAGGIVSSTAGADPTHSTALGYAGNVQLNKTSFAGVSGLTSSDVLVKFTYAGDANLDGQVDIGDLGLLAGAWQQSGKDWFGGDFTYDGTVDIGDLGLLAGNWQKGVGNPL
jgi:ELWxxDGT repeat protein